MVTNSVEESNPIRQTVPTAHATLTTLLRTPNFSGSGDVDR